MSHIPLFSILTPVYNPKPSDLRSMIDSVLAQTYSNWELCIVDDCSDNSIIRDILSNYASSDPRIKICFSRERGHISVASNNAFKLSSGDFIALLDHDDLLEPDSMAIAAQCVASVRNCDIIYSDEDAILPDGSYGTPYLKPAWSPDLLLSNMYTSHLSVYRRDLFQGIKGFRTGFEGSQDHDLALRASEKADVICHIPHVLYHWRCAMSSTALDAANKPYAQEAGLRAIQSAVDRRGETGTVENIAGFPGHYRVKYEIPNAKIVFVLYGSHRNVKQVQEQIYHDFRLCSHTDIVTDFCCFTYRSKAFSSKWMLECDADLFMFLDCDLFSPPSANAFLELFSHAMRKSSGVVSGLWIDSRNKIRHAGIYFDRYGNWRLSHNGFDSNDPGYMGRLIDTANVLATGDSCFAISSKKLCEAGWIDEACERYAITDLCLKFYTAGLYNVITPHARFNMRQDSAIFEQGRLPDGLFTKRWGKICKMDPFFHPKAGKGLF